MMDDLRAAKRPRLEESSDADAASEIRAKRSAFLSSLSRPVSPPNTARHDQHHTQQLIERPKIVSSPFKLTRVRGISPVHNRDTISLHDILGDPLIREAWIFNFCFDVNWTMKHFDSDIRSLVKVKIVHGSWRREDRNRQGIENELKNWSNIEEIRAYLPDQFGTHHSKMIILFKHDSTAQVIIHTANMLELDWDHMTQAVWQSPSLPELEEKESQSGSGYQFKTDLLRYIKEYSRLKPLADQLLRHDFSEVRAVLIASVPSRGNNPWGHLALRGAIRTLESSRKEKGIKSASHLVSQVSSIATLPQGWLHQTVYQAGSPISTSIIYPTPADMRCALTGYATGGSIHTKVSTPTHQKQVSSLRPQLNRWGVQSPNAASQAGRHMVPPHIKTYIAFASNPNSAQEGLQNRSSNPAAPTNSPNLTTLPDINWALLTSANLSKQAWGSTSTKSKTSEKENHIASYEIGVLVYPDLFEEDEGIENPNTRRKVRMIPVFGQDTPEHEIGSNGGAPEVLVGLRMPYDLPLTPYGNDEMPWSPSEIYTEPDRTGRTWP